MPIRQSVLREKAIRHVNFSGIGLESLNEKKASTNRTAFLCHSHKDEVFVLGLIAIFEEAGVDLYVDWKDHSMPETPNEETARKIQDRIHKADIFLFLATANSKASRWCPWEIGYADSSNKGVYIIPTSDNYGSYGNEYLDLYPKIDAGTYKKDGKPGFFKTEPKATTGYAISNQNVI
jgi:hypothetical protein